MGGSDTTNFATAVIALLLPMLFVLVINVVFGVIALNMAKKRELRPIPAFFAGLLGSVVTLFIITMFPIKSNY